MNKGKPILTYRLGGWGQANQQQEKNPGPRELLNQKENFLREIWKMIGFLL